MRRIPLCLLLSLGMLSCDPALPSGPDLFVDFDSIDFPMTPLSAAARSCMDGVYDVIQGQNKLGSVVVCAWHANRWRIFSQHDVVFQVCAGGARGDSIKMVGFLRAVRSGTGSRVQFGISVRDGAPDVIRGNGPVNLRIVGHLEDGTTLELRRKRGVNTGRFDVLAHRGGGRNSDRLGVSENSIAMIMYASRLGATGIEVDVKRTRDGELILFHDDSFSPRTVQGAYLLGDVGNYDLAQIKALGRLVNGEEIPTLTQALTAVIDNTDLSLVWLDVKDPAAVAQVVQIQTAMAAYAATKHRDSLVVLLGIPSQEVLESYRPYQTQADALVELDVQTVLSLPRCRAWAPGWARNITPEEVAAVRGGGRKVYTWTVDLRESMADYLQRIDGILSNYPSMVRAIHDAKE